MNIQTYLNEIERYLQRWLTDSEARLAGKFFVDGLPASSAALAFGASFDSVIN